jgi:hypothetical protein
MPKLLPFDCIFDEFSEQEDELIGVKRRTRLQPTQSKSQSKNKQ